MKMALVCVAYAFVVTRQVLMVYGALYVFGPIGAYVAVGWVAAAEACGLWLYYKKQ